MTSIEQKKYGIRAAFGLKITFFILILGACQIELRAMETSLLRWKEPKERFLKELNAESFFPALAIVREDPTLVDIKGDDGNTFLHKIVTCYQQGYRDKELLVELFEELLTLGARVDEVTPHKQTVCERLNENTWFYRNLIACIEECKQSASGYSSFSEDDNDDFSSTLPFDGFSFLGSSEDIVTKEVQDTLYLESVTLIPLAEEHSLRAFPTPSSTASVKEKVFSNNNNGKKVQENSSFYGRICGNRLFIVGAVGGAFLVYRYKLLHRGAKKEQKKDPQVVDAVHCEVEFDRNDIILLG